MVSEFISNNFDTNLLNSKLLSNNISYKQFITINVNHTKASQLIQSKGITQYLK